ncbi:MAG: GNAT family N-acetyltransferase [Oscillospiraceae bacterium]|jgi:GNAT superfamily N-acetyltransferase|nr:GNAT family N-acetyltransferase [Oscillospiraceae bacterium]HBC26191.1 GNAT family N-acetyltransferase [Oscillospiraceae bacterium]
MKGDMLVRLWNIPEDTGERALAAQGISIKRALSANRDAVVRYVSETFGGGWGGECSAALSQTPTACYLAVSARKIIGFACFNATAPDFFGPTGVSPEFRGKGVGKTLFLKCLHTMREMGYVYAVIGDTDEASPFYEKTAGAIPIPDSYPGVYKNLISK